MNKLTFNDDTPIDDNLVNAWNSITEPSWKAYVKSLDSNIVSVEYLSATTITFKKEEHITWFLLRWS